MEILELIYQDGLNPKKVSATNGGEYHSPCPACGGKDRFIIWSTQNRYYCRRCEKTGDTIQYLRDFHKLSFKEACTKANIVPKLNVIGKPKRTYVFNPMKNTPPSLKWQAKAYDFIYHCHQHLLSAPKALCGLKTRGFSLESVKRFQLGWNPESVRLEWLIEDTKRKIWLPKGIVIPSYIYGNLCKVKIRRNDWNINDKFPKYIEVSGSMPSPMVYGSIDDNLPVIILESELDAMLIQQEAGNLCFAIALGGASKKPDTYVNSLLVKNSLILFSLDYDEAGIKAFKWWKKQYANICVWVPPRGKSPGDAFKEGVDLYEWMKIGIEENIKIKKRKVNESK